MSVLKYLDGETYKALSFLAVGTQMKLLWENASPASAFAAQTLDVNTSGYDLILYEFVRSNGENPHLSEIVQAGKDVQVSFYYGDDKAGAHRRTASGGSLTSIVWGTGQYNGALNNNYLIPYRIYGIKLAAIE